MSVSYTERSLRGAIYYIVPHYRKSIEEQGREMLLSQMISYAIVIAFTLQPTHHGNSDFDDACYILRQAYIDHEKFGVFKFSNQGVQCE